MTEEEFKELDLVPGDLVRYSEDKWRVDTFMVGTLTEDGDGCLALGPFLVWPSADLPEFPWPVKIQVLEKVPRRIYVNHTRTEPVRGDVVRDGDLTTSRLVWVRTEDSWFGIGVHLIRVDREDMPKKLKLLVDGDTGQVVL